MSQRALLISVYEHVKRTLKYADLEIGIEEDGQPNPVCGNVYVAIHPGEWVTVPCEGLHEKFGIQVTVTVRTSVAPLDRIPTGIFLGDTGKNLSYHVERLRRVLHMDPAAPGESQHYPVTRRANAIINEHGTENGFVTPLRLQSVSQPIIKMADWFHAEAMLDDIGTERAPSGLAQTLMFSGAERIQVIGEAS